MRKTVFVHQLNTDFLWWSYTVLVDMLNFVTGCERGALIQVSTPLLCYEKEIRKWQLILKDLIFGLHAPHIFLYLCHVCNLSVAQLLLHCVRHQGSFYSQLRYQGDTELRPAACSPCSQLKIVVIHTAKYKNTKGFKGEASRSLMHYLTFSFFAPDAKHGMLVSLSDLSLPLVHLSLQPQYQHTP